jgi:hypothetical protein
MCCAVLLWLHVDEAKVDAMSRTKTKEGVRVRVKGKGKGKGKKQKQNAVISGK